MCQWRAINTGQPRSIADTPDCPDHKSRAADGAVGAASKLGFPLVPLTKIMPYPCRETSASHDYGRQITNGILPFIFGVTAHTEATDVRRTNNGISCPLLALSGLRRVGPLSTSAPIARRWLVRAKERVPVDRLFSDLAAL